MFRYVLVVLMGGLYLFGNPVFAASAKPSSNIPESFRPHLIHHIQKQASSEYEVHSVSSARAGYQAKNAAHNLALGFGAEGVDVRPEQDPEWRMGMKLSAIGYGEELQPVALGVMTTSGNRVEVRYGDTESSLEVTEWYLNGPLGLEQGFTLNRPPVSKPKTGDLVLTLTLSGDLKAVPNDAGREVRFQTARGKTALRFRDLYVFDATGRKLSSRFISAHNGYGIRVDDASAVYPITIDPLLIDETKLTASDAAAEDFFGTSVAVDGNTAVVGASHDDDKGGNSGSAYVFVRSAGVWTEKAKLTASDGFPDTNFGVSVAIDGNTIVVSTHRNNLFEVSGAAYVFVGSGSSWFQQAKLTGDGVSEDEFGISVAIDGNTIVVGARGDNSFSGAAYVFVRSSGSWTEQEKLTASDAAAVDLFGGSVAINGDTVVVGASRNDSAGPDSGAVYVFVRSGSSWSQQAKLTGKGRFAESFGRFVAVSGDTVVMSGGGLVYVYVGSGSSWSQQAKLTTSDGEFFEGLVAVSGDTVVVGASDGNLRSGSVYVFARSGSAWARQAKLTASDAADGDHFGSSSAVSGNTVLVGAFRNDDAGTNSGSAYIYEIVGIALQATLAGTMFCNDISGGITKQKFKDEATFTLDVSAFPLVTANLQMTAFADPFTLYGMALLKNPKSGVIQLFGSDINSRELAISGNMKKDKSLIWASIKGKFQFEDPGTPVCTLAGKFKAK